MINLFIKGIIFGIGFVIGVVIIIWIGFGINCFYEELKKKWVNKKGEK